MSGVVRIASDHGAFEAPDGWVEMQGLGAVARPPTGPDDESVRPSVGLKAAIKRSMTEGATSGMSPRQMTAPATSAGRAAMPVRNEVERPRA